MYENHKPLKINIISDIHYYSQKTGVTGKAFEKENVKTPNDLLNCEKILSALMDQLAEDECEIVLVSGDVTTRAEIEAHEGVIRLLRSLRQRGKKVYVITATHDFHDGDVTRRFDGDSVVQVPAVKREELYDLYREFGPDEAISVHRDSMSYVVQLCDGYRLFALNDDRNHKGASGFSDDCFEWIEAQIKDAHENGQFIIPMTHHPMLSPSPFYTIIGRSNIMGEAERRIDELTELGVNYMFTGHTHMQDISYKYTEKDKIFYDITTAAAVGYPATFRQVTFLPSEGKIDVNSVDVQCDINGRPLKEHLEDKFFGMIRRVIDAAGKDIPELARLATAFSVKEKLIYKIGWIIKPFAKLLSKLKIGTVAKLVKKESGLKKKDYAHIKDNKVTDFIVSLVRNLYGGDSPYSPDTAEYKITMGILAIIDSLLNLFGVKIGKILKGATSVQSLVEPLLYNSGICDEKAVLNLRDNLPEKQENAEHFVKSNKALPIVILLVLLVLVFLPIILLWLGIGFIVNRIKYGKLMK
ncbi:MAG: metallophosphoesterase [Ruminococcaceae bacterium]|nr:metallophosphoesterase [Oscillospiraceae bacterium]